VKVFLCLTVLVSSALFADETTERAAIEATVAALNTSPSQPNLFTRDFANADELQRFLGQAEQVIESGGVVIRTEAATLTISREPMGEATVHFRLAKRFVTRSVTFLSPDTAVVVAIHQRQFKPTTSQRIPALFVLRREGSAWRIASFRVLAEASPTNVP
jgi:hypothetical protein